MSTPQYGDFQFGRAEYPVSEHVWSIGGRPLRPSAIEADHETLGFEARITRDELDQWRELDATGDVDSVVGTNGDFYADDRTDNATLAVRVLPPPEWEPTPWDRFDAVVSDYAEEQVAPDGYEITVEVTRDTNRTRAVADPAESGTWEFEFSRGTIALDDRQVLVTEQEASPAGGSWTLSLLVEDLEARTAMESLGHVGATAEREIPDAGNTVVDTTTSDWNTVTVTSPSGSELLDGSSVTAVATEWSLEWHSHRHWLLEIELVP